MMDNKTYMENCFNNLNYNKILHISNIVWIVCGLIGIIIGIPGHIFQIIILLIKSNRKEPISLYFIAIAISELIFLIGLSWLWCSNISLIKTDPREVLSCGIFYSILIGSTILSNLYLASMSIDGSIMLLSPTKYRSLVTPSRVLLRIVLICLIIIVFLIPHYFYLYYDRNHTIFLCDFHSFVDQRRVRCWSFIHTIFFVSIPLLIVCIYSFILLQNRCKHKRTYRQNLSKSARQMYRNSIVIFFISIGIFLSVLPICILEIIIVHDRSFNQIICSKRWKIYRTLLNCFLTLSSVNYSAKFYIHLIISISFRKKFIQFICCKSNENTSQLTRMNNEACLIPLRNQNNSTPF